MHIYHIIQYPSALQNIILLLYQQISKFFLNSDNFRTNARPNYGCTVKIPKKDVIKKEKKPKKDLFSICF